LEIESETTISHCGEMTLKDAIDDCDGDDKDDDDCSSLIAHLVIRYKVDVQRLKVISILVYITWPNVGRVAQSV
jgi:hypothetical protein